MARIDLWTIHIGLREVLNFTPQNFIEIGSRDGHDTKTVQEMFKLLPSNCYIFEAHPELANQIEKRYPEFIVNNCAISNLTQPITFNAADLELESNPGMSSVLDMVDDGFKSKKVEIDGWRVDDILQQLCIDNVDLVKIDVEGFSLEVLEGFGSMLCSYDDVSNFLIKNGFTQLLFARIAHDQSDSLWVKNELILR